MASTTAVGVVAIVDDDASVRRSMKNLLSSAGYHVETYAAAQEFLRAPAREDTDCLVLDLRMPGMTGLDLLARLRASGSTVPVVVVTAHGEEEARALEAGAFAFLTKPFRVDALLAVVKAALGARP
jgi:FixJ family two-component response regulator